MIVPILLLIVSLIPAVLIFFYLRGIRKDDQMYRHTANRLLGAGLLCCLGVALLALVLLSYIQAFSDGNKRTARITSNAILIANKYCPISFRTVDSVDYKKAMLIFYEQNNLSAFKKIFIDQFAFAVQTYF